jgi:hypothetical protein
VADPPSVAGASLGYAPLGAAPIRALGQPCWPQGVVQENRYDGDLAEFGLFAYFRNS